MPGAQDRWGQLTEPSAPRKDAVNADLPYVVEQPERGSLADLRRRMERLPPGHPSSPYNDDMTRKPPVARLKDLELPLHGGEHTGNGAATRHAHDAAEGAGAPSVSGNGSSGRNLTVAALGAFGEPDETADASDGDAPASSAESPQGTPEWLSAPTWNDTHPRSTAGPERSDPGPGADTLTHPVIDPGPSRGTSEPSTGPDGSWEWNGRYLTPEECQIAEEAIGRCRIAEGRNVFGGYGHSGLTPAMRRIEAQLEHGRLLADTEDCALKPAERFKEKLADLILRHPDKPAEELALEVHDGIRYAFIFETEHYAEGTLQAHSRLKGNGFDLESRRNCWQSPEYKGINSRWRDPAHDLVFEVQFHTADSWDLRQRAHALYEAITDPATSPGERERLRGSYAQMSAPVALPPGCTAIPDYRKEG